MELSDVVIEECSLSDFVMLKGYHFSACRPPEVQARLRRSLRSISERDNLGFGLIRVPYKGFSFEDIAYRMAEIAGVRKFSFRKKGVKGWTNVPRNSVEDMFEQGLVETDENHGYIMKVNFKAQYEFSEMMFEKFSAPEPESIDVSDGSGKVVGSVVFEDDTSFGNVFSFAINFPIEHTRLYQWKGGHHRKIESLWVPDSYLNGKNIPKTAQETS